MKTLVICGTYSHHLGQRAQDPVVYEVCLMGQIPEQPLIQVIGYYEFMCRGYDELQELCRAKYCEYYKTDLFNIISINHLIRQDTVEAGRCFG